ncbi:MAG: MarR family transcriptional regulator [Bacteroidales bacterium]|nr:MarR family transcriptional regulator [Candidatus Scybalousia scybalohippi]
MTYNQLKLDNQLCFRLYTAARLITSSYTPYFKKFNITYPQYLVLMLLWEKDNCIISEITERLHLETNTITPLLQRMEKQGLILRQKSEVDNRRRIVSLTSKGKRLEEQMKEIPNCLAREIVDNGMNVEELQNMIPLLDKFILTIKEK